MYDFNQIDEDTIQIYGSINGSAWRSELNGQIRWNFDISFFKGAKQIKVSNYSTATIWNVEMLKEKIKKVYNEKNE